MTHVVVADSEARCRFKAMWWDGDSEGTYACVLDPHDQGLHFTGREWVDQDGEPVECRCSSPTQECPAHLSKPLFDTDVAGGAP